MVVLNYKCAHELVVVGLRFQSIVLCQTYVRQDAHVLHQCRVHY